MEQKQTDTLYIPKILECEFVAYERGTSGYTAD